MENVFKPSNITKYSWEDNLCAPVLCVPGRIHLFVCFRNSGSVVVFSLEVYLFDMLFPGSGSGLF